MIIRDPSLTLTPALAAWLRGAHDDGQPALDVHERCAICAHRREVCRCSHLVRHYQIQVLRADGSDLSPTEEREVRALLAAHAAEPLTMPTK